MKFRANLIQPHKKLSCYVNSILKTDKLIENVIDLLKKQNENYSVIYFSDHGLSHKNKEKIEELDLDYDPDFKQNYDVPFFKLSSDDTKRELVNIQRSAFNFIYGFSQWLGIKTKELNTEYDFFSDKNDENIEVFNFEENIPYKTLKNDDIP